MHQEANKGFTLIEVIVAIAVVAILAGIITPSVIKHLDDSKRARAQNDCQVVGSTLASFYKDTGRWPNMDASGATGAAALTLLVGEGATPTAAGAAANWGQATTAATADLMAYHLVSNRPKNQAVNIYNATGEFRWSGPYHTSFTSDPWGNRYAVNVGNMFSANNAVWVISAGPNGVINTAFNQAIPNNGVLALAQDDIGYRLR